MTKVAIMPVASETGTMIYQAVAGDKHSQGGSAGAALDALTAQLSEDEAGTLVIIQNGRPDVYFNANQQRRLAELMASWRSARDHGTPFSADKQQELEALIEMEVRASAARTATLADELKR